MSEVVEQAAPPSRRWAMVRSAGMGLALAGTIGIGWRHTHPPERAHALCHADAVVLEDGRTLHHDTEHSCAWVDGHGNLVPVDNHGAPISR